MKKQIRKFVCLALALVFMAGFAPQTAEAKTRYVNKTTWLEQDEWQTAKGRSDKYNPDSGTTTFTYHLYKISVPSNGYTVFKTESSKTDLGVYEAPKSGKAYYESKCIVTLSGAKTYYRVLKKGTYYVYAEKGDEFMWTFRSYANPTNYCIAKASSLAANQKVTVAYNHGYEYARWYKISTTSKKTIAMTLKELDKGSMSISLYNSKKESVSLTVSGNVYKTKSSVSKGTYYIRVRSDSYDTIFGRIAQLSWK